MGGTLSSAVMDELALAERLIAYDTSKEDGLRAAAEFVKGWLETREVRVTSRDHEGLPVIIADAGPLEGPLVVLHGHLDVVPAFAEQFVPRLEGDRLIGRGAYDMKGALAALVCAVHDASLQDEVRVRLICVPDEESENVENRSTAVIVGEGIDADFAITGEPTDLHIGVQAKGVLALRLEVVGTAAHGSTPWLGDNAILKANDLYRRIETLPFSRQSSDLFDRPSINLARVTGGDAFNKVPDRCLIDVDIRYLPGQDPDQIIEQIERIDDLKIVRKFHRVPAIVSRQDPYVLALRAAVSSVREGEALSIGRDGASDAISFLEAGIPAVEFGPEGGGHHGPNEWVSVSSLKCYRQALAVFIRDLPGYLGKSGAPPKLRAVEG